MRQVLCRSSQSPRPLFMSPVCPEGIWACSLPPTPKHASQKWAAKMKFLHFLGLPSFLISLDSTCSTLEFLFLLLFSLIKLSMLFWEVEKSQPLKCQKTAGVAHLRHLYFPCHMSNWWEAIRRYAACFLENCCWVLDWGTETFRGHVSWVLNMDCSEWLTVSLFISVVSWLCF